MLPVATGFAINSSTSAGSVHRCGLERASGLPALTMYVPNTQYCAQYRGASPCPRCYLAAAGQVGYTRHTGGRQTAGDMTAGGGGGVRVSISSSIKSWLHMICDNCEQAAGWHRPVPPASSGVPRVSSITGAERHGQGFFDLPPRGWKKMHGVMYCRPS